jgi:hypothetical protein
MVMDMQAYKNLNCVKILTKTALRQRYTNSHLFLKRFWVPFELAYALNNFVT